MKRISVNIIPRRSTKALLLSAAILAGFAFVPPIRTAAVNLLGDLNNDGSVNSSDLKLVTDHFKTTSALGDVNADGKTNLLDLSIILSHFNNTSGPAQPAPFHIIYLSKLTTDANDIAQYNIMKSNPHVVPAFRTDSVAESQKWETKGYNYYYMVASSDYTVCNSSANPYVSQAAVDGALNGAHNQGIYLHEVAAIYACAGGWNWDTAVTKINWPLLNQWALSAKAHGKKFVWSEPAEGWRALAANPTGDAYMRTWGDTLVPEFATNYTIPSQNVPPARSYALAAAQKYNTEFGESIQSWYWIDPAWNYTQADATAVANYGHAAGATYFEIEGTCYDMRTTDVFMKGVNDFIRGLGPTALPKQSGSGASLPPVRATGSQNKNLPCG